MIDHDRLFKELLSSFFVEFIELFLPDVMAYLEPDSVISLPVASKLYVILSATAVERRIYAHARDASLRFSSFATLTDSA